MQAEFKMNPWFVTGFSDAESCFTLSVVRNKERKIGWRVSYCFQITIHKKDLVLLEQIQSYFLVGSITNHRYDSIHYRVQTVENLIVIVNHFDKYPLITKKWADYQLFKQVLMLIQNKEHLTMEGLSKIVAIKASMNNGLPDELKAAFPNIIPAPRPLIESIEIKDSAWLAGFIEAEGCFQVLIQKSSFTKIGLSVSLRFTLTQHSRDEQLLKSLVNYLGCGGYYLVSGRDLGKFIVTRFSDIESKIMPFFDKYPLQGVKSLDYADWCRVAELIKDKKHLTQEGLDQIRKIKAGMNTGRK